jgi:hypothetical protein
MTQPRDIDRILNAWFNDGPTVASDRVIDVVADRIERQAQRPAWRLLRRPRRLDINVRFAAVVAAALVAVGMVGFSLGGGFTAPSHSFAPANTTGPTTAATPTDRATPTPRRQVPLTSRFTSAVNRYSISYPDAWTVKPATATPRWGSSLSLHDPTVDVLSAPGGRTALYITSIAVPEGVPENDWPAAQLLRPDAAVICTQADERRPTITVSVAGVIGSAGKGCNAMGYMTPITGHRGFEFLMTPSPVGSGSDEEWANQDLFVAMLRSVELNP